MSDAIPERVSLSPDYSTDQAERLAGELFGISGTFDPLPSERDQNFRVTRGDGERFVLKIANAAEKREELELQNAAMRHVGARSAAGVICPEVHQSLDGKEICSVEGVEGRRYFVRLLTYLPGRPLARAKPHTPALLHSLGVFFGRLDAALADFDHPAAERDFYWDLANAGRVVEEYAALAEAGREAGILPRALARYREIVLPRVSDLRRSTIHSDGNDHNVLAVRHDSGEYEVSGVIDFGDMVHSCNVYEPAIATAYAILGKADPLRAAAHVVSGYHEAFPLTEDELAVLFPLICMRLCMSVCIAAEQKRRAPDNEYLGITERAAWEALARLDGIHPRRAEYTLRDACGLTPCPRGVAVAEWLAGGKVEIAPLAEFDLADPRSLVLDLSVGSTELGLVDSSDTDAFTALVCERIRASGAPFAWGRYDEPRRIYTAPQFGVESDEQPETRTIHLGVDLFAEAGTPVLAPLDGTVHSFQVNPEPLDYGPTILLEHRTGDGSAFYTLYGHLAASSLEWLQVGMGVDRGQRIATIGAPPENGGWPPHLHFQIIADLLDGQGNFPGVAAPREREVWLSICPDPNLLLRIPGNCLSAPRHSTAQLLEQRRRRSSDALSLAYREPLEIVRGAGAYLFDSEGRGYLDCVNNVCHVGHCHPRVVRAGREQMEVLNTNTRYLHPLLVEYSRRLCAKLPEPLTVCLFVNSGSEANELALRLARAHTGRSDVITVEGAYHGHTQALIEISPYKFDGPGGAGCPDWVHPVTMPDGYRGPHRGRGRETGERYAEAVRDALDWSGKTGRKIGAFICESLLSCGGQIVLPDGYLDAAYHHIRSAGGVAIADEVQVGFGRVGSHFWGFETQGVVPDIVTLGKPIGNGHPLAAVITTREIADSFANGMEYFNTFGGNPVSCAIGLAVLEVIEEEQLQQHARDVGARLLAELDQLGRRHPIIGEVRGRGLFVGVELVRDRRTLEPAADEASYVVERMKQHGVLLSTDGPLRNVLKIKPPMVFGEDEVMTLVRALDRVLDDDYPTESA